jgi:hypothetical protein
VLVIVGLGCIGFRVHAAARGRTLGLLDVLYLRLQLLTLESGPVAPAVPWTLQITTPGFPTAIGVLRSVEAPAYEMQVADQVRQVTERKGKGDLGPAAGRRHVARARDESDVSARHRVVHKPSSSTLAETAPCAERGVQVAVEDARDDAQF